MSLSATKLATSWRKNWPEVRAAASGGLPAFVLSPRSPEPGDGVPAFCYHVVDAGAFEADLAFLRANGYTTIGPDDLLRHMTREAPAPPRSVVLTFDDGAVNLYRVAFPLLRAHGFRATAFIAPRYHDAASAVASDAPARPCTWAEIEEMHASGVIRFESHTLEHRYVPRWPEPVPLAGVDDAWVRAALGPPTTLEADLAGARDAIERRLGVEVRHLAWPRYDATPAALAAGRAAGYRAFWGGVLPGVDMNRPGGDPTRIVRLSGDLLRRLPGDGRVPLAEVLTRRARRRTARGTRPGSS